VKYIFGLLLMFGALSTNASAISEKYAQLGGANGFLGAPTIPETTTPDGVGSFRHYQQGSIYFHPSTGAHEVHGLIRQKWAALGWELSPLGYPMTDEIDLFDGSGKVSKFQGGEILWKSKTNAVSVVKGTDLRIDVPFPSGTVWHVIAANNDHHGNAWAYCWDFNLHTQATVGEPFASVASALSCSSMRSGTEKARTASSCRGWVKGNTFPTCTSLRAATRNTPPAAAESRCRLSRPEGSPSQTARPWESSA
jgi:LGFP repeat